MFEAATRAAMVVRDAGYGGVGPGHDSMYKSVRPEKEDSTKGCCIIA